MSYYLMFPWLSFLIEKLNCWTKSSLSFCGWPMQCMPFGLGAGLRGPATFPGAWISYCAAHWQTLLRPIKSQDVIKYSLIVTCVKTDTNDALNSPIFNFFKKTKPSLCPLPIVIVLCAFTEHIVSIKKYSGKLNL